MLADKIPPDVMLAFLSRVEGECAAAALLKTVVAAIPMKKLANCMRDHRVTELCGEPPDEIARALIKARWLNCTNKLFWVPVSAWERLRNVENV